MTRPRAEQTDNTNRNTSSASTYKLSHRRFPVLSLAYSNPTNHISTAITHNAYITEPTNPQPNTFSSPPLPSSSYSHSLSHRLLNPPTNKMLFTNMEFVLNKKVDQGRPLEGCTLSKKVDQGRPLEGCTLSKVDQGRPLEGCTLSFA